jgi:hypothetical protein
MTSRLCSFLAFSLIVASSLLGAMPTQADQQSAADELQVATDLILSYAKGEPAPPERVLDSTELLRAYELAPKALVTALSRLQREAPSAVARSGLPLALLAGEIIDQQRAVAFPDALDAGTRARSKAMVEAQNLAAQLRLDRTSAMKAPATPDRDRLLLRLDAVGLSVDMLLAPQTVTDSAKALAGRALALGGDPVAYREAIHALNWSLRDDDKEAFRTIEALRSRPARHLLRTRRSWESLNSIWPTRPRRANIAMRQDRRCAERGRFLMRSPTAFPIRCAIGTLRCSSPP